MSIGAQGEIKFIRDKLFVSVFLRSYIKHQWHLNAILQTTIL